MRLCKVCAKPASERDAYLLCDEHLREYRRQFNLRRRKKLAQQQRQRYARDPKPYIAAKRAWEKKNAIRLHLVHGAGGYVRWAVATGLLQKPKKCERCGFDGVVEAAHADYSRPLEVEWLCRSCHRTWDKEGHPKTMPRLGMVVFEGDLGPDGDKT